MVSAVAAEGTGVAAALAEAALTRQLQMDCRSSLVLPMAVTASTPSQQASEADGVGDPVARNCVHGAMAWVTLEQDMARGCWAATGG